MKIIIYFILFFLFSSSFSYADKISRKERKERKKYEKLKSSFKYLGYSVLSKNLVTATCVINEKSEKIKYKPAEHEIHSYLGLLSAYTPFADYAIAEGNILIEKSKYDYLKVIAYDIISISLKKKEWFYLSKAMSAESGKIVVKDSFPDLNSRIIFNMVHTVRLVMDDSLAKSVHYCSELNKYANLKLKIDVENKDGQYKTKWLTNFFNEIEKINIENWTSFKGIIDEINKKRLKN